MRYGTHVHGRPGRNDLILFVAAALQKNEPKMISEDFTYTQYGGGLFPVIGL